MLRCRIWTGVGSPSIPDGWRQRPSWLGFRASGRYGVQVDEVSFSRTIVFRTEPAPESTAPTCPVTLPNGGAPADPWARWPADLSHGNDAETLFTHLLPDGMVVFRSGGPGQKNADGSLEMK